MIFTHLIQAEELQQLRQENWLIIDVSHQLAAPNAGEQQYLKERIPGALFMDVNTHLSAPTNGHNGRHPLPTKEEFRKTVSDFGMTPDTQVIIYDQNTMFAPRLWWMLQWIGHQSVAILDGGLPSWKQLGFELDHTILTSSTPPSTLKVAPYPERSSQAVTLNVADIETNLATKTLTLLDARATSRYHGEGETIDPVGGHIPGALNRCFQENLSAANRFKSSSELNNEFTTLLDKNQLSPEQIIHQCGSGVTACHNLFAMSYAGLGFTKLYPGSWSEWCSDPHRPTTL